MCGQGSHLRALKDEKVPSKEPGNRSSRKAKGMCKGPEVAESGLAEQREGEGEMKWARLGYRLS